MMRSTLLDHFSALEDSRQAWKVVYPLSEILLIVLCGTMAGAEDFADIERWAIHKLAFLRRFLPFVRGVPSHDTLNDVMNALPAKLFSECFVAIPLLLARFELEGALVTIDAIGCQKDIAEAIRARGADFLLALKDNWPTLAEDVRLFFEREPAKPGEVFASTDGDHGRIELRRCRVSHDVAWLSTNRRFPGEPRFPALAMIGMIEAEVEREGKSSLSRRYYLFSAPLSPEKFAAAARAHWGVENRLHWVLDVVFHDDLMRLRTANGPANMAVVKHMILNLIKEIPDKASLKTRRKTLGWDDQYLANAISQPWK